MQKTAERILKRQLSVIRNDGYLHFNDLNCIFWKINGSTYSVSISVTLQYEYINKFTFYTSKQRSLHQLKRIIQLLPNLETKPMNHNFLQSFLSRSPREIWNMIVYIFIEIPCWLNRQSPLAGWWSVKVQGFMLAQNNIKIQSSRATDPPHANALFRAVTLQKSTSVFEGVAHQCKA